MRTHRVANFINLVHNIVHGCIEPNGKIRIPHIVIDRSRNADDGNAALAESIRTFKAAVAADDDKPFNFVCTQNGNCLFDSALRFKLLAPRRAKYRSSLVHFAFNVGMGKVPDPAFNKAFVAVVNAHYLQIDIHPGFENGAYRRIHARSVASAC